MKNVNSQLESILFPVQMVDSSKITKMPSNSEYSQMVVGLIDKKETVLNVCSDRYELIPNSEIFPNIREILLNNKIKFSEHYENLHNARFYATYVIEDKKFAYKVANSNDVIKPQIRVTHSYNGLTKYSINFGYFRLVCSNGLTIPVEEMAKYNLSITGKHTSSIKQSFEKLNDTLNYFVDNAEQISLSINAIFDGMAKEFVTKIDDRIKEVLNVANITAIENNNFNTIDYIKGVIDSEKHLYKGKVNDWLIYNGINSYIFNDTLNKKAPEKRAEIDSKVLEAMIN
jgi:Domain of unknown function (DUF932)